MLGVPSGLPHMLPVLLGASLPSPPPQMFSSSGDQTGAFSGMASTAATHSSSSAEIVTYSNTGDIE